MRLRRRSSLALPSDDQKASAQLVSAGSHVRETWHPGRDVRRDFFCLRPGVAADVASHPPRRRGLESEMTLCNTNVLMVSQGRNAEVRLSLTFGMQENLHRDRFYERKLLIRIRFALQFAL